MNRTSSSPSQRGRRRALALALTLPATIVGALAAGPVFAQAYPAKPVTFVVPFAAGSATDQLARALGQSMTAETKQAVIVDNKAGASGMMAAQSVARFATPVLELPALHKGTMLKIDALDKSFWSAVHHHDAPNSSLGLMERQRLKVWLRQSYGQFERLGL